VGSLHSRRAALETCLAPSAALSAALSADGGLALPLSLGAGLLVVPTLTELGIKARALHLPLEAAERPVETLVVLDDDFQSDGPPWVLETSKKS